MFVTRFFIASMVAISKWQFARKIREFLNWIAVLVKTCHSCHGWSSGVLIVTCVCIFCLTAEQTDCGREIMHVHVIVMEIYIDHR